ncbi:MAG: nucleoside monophosphate kinase [Patescibacteria group bacterium]|nr:nucleoside monophosphate kinase [Patescibacteria group bacterium]
MAKLIKSIGHIKKRAFIWVGPINCGKDTQTDAHEELFGVPVFKTGPVLKDMAKRDPNNPTYEPIFKGGLVPDETVIWTAKKWILANTIHRDIHLNGCPRNVKQVGPIISFLIERGYGVYVIWFVTPIPVCLDFNLRPVRPGRELEDTPRNRATRMATYIWETTPAAIEMCDRFGICEENHNMLFVDNSSIRKDETAGLILQFMGLPFTGQSLFPDKNQRRPALAIN